jgi:ribosome maturation factor RimP
MPEPSQKRESLLLQVRALAEPMIMAEKMELVDLEFAHEHSGWVLRLLIDKPGGVNLDDCAMISRAVGTALDVEDIIDRPYHLEVSSPGLNRPLKRPEHFRQAEGKRVRLKTFAPLGDPPRRNFTGLLKGVADDAVMLEVPGGGDFRIPFGEIAKANLEFDF